MDFTVPEFDIERNRDRCTLCGACVKECSYKVHFFSKDKKAVLADERKCVACHRCAVICPSHAIKIVKYDMAYRDHSDGAERNYKAGDYRRRFALGYVKQ